MTENPYQKLTPEGIAFFRSLNDDHGFKVLEVDTAKMIEDWITFLNYSRFQEKIPGKGFKPAEVKSRPFIDETGKEDPSRIQIYVKTNSGELHFSTKLGEPSVSGAPGTTAICLAQRGHYRELKAVSTEIPPTDNYDVYVSRMIGAANIALEYLNKGSHQNLSDVIPAIDDPQSDSCESWHHFNKYKLSVIGMKYDEMENQIVDYRFGNSKAMFNRKIYVTTTNQELVNTNYKNLIPNTKLGPLGSEDLVVWIPNMGHDMLYTRTIKHEGISVDEFADTLLGEIEGVQTNGVGMAMDW